MRSVNGSRARCPGGADRCVSGARASRPASCPLDIHVPGDPRRTHRQRRVVPRAKHRRRWCPVHAAGSDQEGRSGKRSRLAPAARSHLAYREPGAAPRCASRRQCSARSVRKSALVMPSRPRPASITMSRFRSSRRWRRKLSRVTRLIRLRHTALGTRLREIAMPSRAPPKWFARASIRTRAPPERRGRAKTRSKSRARRSLKGRGNGEREDAASEPKLRRSACFVSWRADS